MNAEEQINAYKELRQHGQAFFVDDYVDADRIIEALERQIPMKPKDLVWDYGAIREFKCPACGAEYYAIGIKGLSKGKHCERCGQKLDWGEEESV